MSKQTAMQQLLTQLKEERTKLPLPIEWDRCYQAIEMAIQHTYLAIEREQIICSRMNLMTDDELSREVAEQYYKKTYME